MPKDCTVKDIITFELLIFQKSLNLSMVSDDYRQLQMSFQALTMCLHFSQLNRDGKGILEGTTEREEENLRSMVRLCVLQPLTSQVCSLSLSLFHFT